MPSALITLTTAGTGTGPFNLFSNVGGYVTPFETNVPKASLQAGYTSVLVPAGTTIIRVKSTSAGCTNYVDISVTGITTTTTSTSTTAAPINAWLNNNTGLTVSGSFVFAVKIGAGAFNTVYSATTSIAPGAKLQFYTSFYPGANPTTGNTFKVDVYTASGLSSANYIQLNVGSSSTPGYFTMGSPASTAQTYSSGSQYQMYIDLY